MHRFLNTKGVRGYTTMELVVYLALFIVLSLFLTQALSTMARSFLALRLNQSVTASASDILERMVRDMRLASSIDTAQTIFDASPGKLVLQAGATTTEYALLDGAITLRENGISTGQISNPGVVVSSLVFRKASSTSALSVRAEFSLYDKRAASTTKRTFYGTALLRGGY
ncbi:MAG: hypothetical protein V4674_02115 [Patescibacteria group bacterium]